MFNVNARWTMLLTALLVVGCARPRFSQNAVDRVTLSRRALGILSAAVRYDQNPAVRVAAVEALETAAPDEGAAWIRAALWDDHAAVRFAACLAVGRLRDAESTGTIRARVSDVDANVQVAALFALHRLGREENTGRMATYLLAGDDVTLRRNAGLVLGMMDEPSAVKVLARAMEDRDPGVRHHALEAMARLGNREARQELTFMTNAGIGPEEVFAIAALAATRDPVYAQAFRYKLATATHIETRLAAARGLGLLGLDEGYDVALRALRFVRPVRRSANDSREGQALRARQMAASALSAIGRVDALPALARLLDRSRDPRVQVSAARAILEILAVDRSDALPFEADTGRPGN